MKLSKAVKCNEIYQLQRKYNTVSKYEHIGLENEYKSVALFVGPRSCVCNDVMSAPPLPQSIIFFLSFLISKIVLNN